MNRGVERCRHHSMCGFECGHLFLSPLFDMVKCSLILVWGPFPVLFITYGLGLVSCWAYLDAVPLQFLGFLWIRKAGITRLGGGEMLSNDRLGNLILMLSLGGAVCLPRVSCWFFLLKRLLRFLETVFTLCDIAVLSASLFLDCG